ncbi:hypothetical protein N7G274_003806 [Stereocaulon virgatum]|uniref:Cytochrome P450 n=1 Tax=Stereocaulon virgatum TaxID=373712 RepID=A0ABR4ACC3_9LECA
MLRKHMVGRGRYSEGSLHHRFRFHYLARYQAVRFLISYVSKVNRRRALERCINIDMAGSIQLLVAIVIVVVLVVVSRLLRRDDPEQLYFTEMRGELRCGKLRGSYLTWMRDLLGTITGMVEIVDEGYDQFSKRGRLFVLASMGSGSIVVLPSSHLQILSRPENQVAAFEVQLETWQPRYTIGNKELYESTINSAFKVVRKQLMKDVGRFTGPMAHELAAGIEKYWGSLEEWTTVNVYDTCSQIIARTTSRLFFGLPLCRDEKLLEQCRHYSTAVFGSAALISALPPILQKVLGPVIAFPAKQRLATCTSILMPYVERRLLQTRERKAVSNDVLQCMIDEAYQTNPEQLEAAHLTQSLLILILSAIHSTSYGFTNCILDLNSSDCCDDFIAGIREECECVSADSGGLGNRVAVDRLHRIDSCIKESLRISGFTVVSLMRVISATNGLKLDDATVIPKGVRVGAPMQAIHHDSSFYHDPFRFNAFRFSETCESPRPRGQPHQNRAQTRTKELSTNTNEKFLTYGIGRHACPGRFFASQMMSLALAYVVQNYDVEHISKRPKSQPILNILMPPTSATIRIRRRAKN